MNKAIGWFGLAASVKYGAANLAGAYFRQAIIGVENSGAINLAFRQDQHSANQRKEELRHHPGKSKSPAARVNTPTARRDAPRNGNDQSPGRGPQPATTATTASEKWSTK